MNFRLAIRFAANRSDRWQPNAGTFIPRSGVTLRAGT